MLREVAEHRKQAPLVGGVGDGNPKPYMNVRVVGWDFEAAQARCTPPLSEAERHALRVHRCTHEPLTLNPPRTPLGRAVHPEQKSYPPTSGCAGCRPLGFTVHSAWGLGFRVLCSRFIGLRVRNPRPSGPRTAVWLSNLGFGLKAVRRRTFWAQSFGLTGFRAGVKDASLTGHDIRISEGLVRRWASGP